MLLIFYFSLIAHKKQESIYIDSGGVFVSDKNKERNEKVVILSHRQEEKERSGKLILDDVEHELKSFIISGETPEGKRIIFTWNASLDEILSYNCILNICIQDKVRDSLNQQ